MVRTNTLQTQKKKSLSAKKNQVKMLSSALCHGRFHKLQAHAIKLSQVHNSTFDCPVLQASLSYVCVWHQDEQGEDNVISAFSPILLGQDS